MGELSYEKVLSDLIEFHNNVWNGKQEQSLEEIDKQFMRMSHADKASLLNAAYMIMLNLAATKDDTSNGVLMARRILGSFKEATNKYVVEVTKKNPTGKESADMVLGIMNYHTLVDPSKREASKGS